jgi:hypothetical protein
MYQFYYPPPASSFCKACRSLLHEQEEQMENDMPEQLERLEHLEALIDGVLQQEVPMTLTELINMIAQPHHYDRFCARPA